MHTDRENIMDKILDKALKTFRPEKSKTTLHNSDEDYIKMTLRTLKKHEIDFNEDVIESWLIEQGWGSIPIKQIKAWVKAISSGGSVRLKNKEMATSEKHIWKNLNA